MARDNFETSSLGREFTSVFSSSWVASFKVLDAPVPMATPRRHDATTPYGVRCV